MTSNDVLRRIRYTFDYSDTQMMELFAHADMEVNREQVCSWLKQDDDPGFVEMTDKLLATFLNGLINALRGRREGPQAVPEERLSNNMILMKLRIALDLQSDNVLTLLESVGLSFSKHELSALFRKPGHKHYRVCEDQVLRNFLKGLQLHFREGAASAPQEQ